MKHQTSIQECDQERSQRRFAGDIARYAQRHSGFAAGIDRLAYSLRGPLYGVRHFADQGFFLERREALSSRGASLHARLRYRTL
jgi:hypothetical protein